MIYPGSLPPGDDVTYGLIGFYGLFPGFLLKKDIALGVQGIRIEGILCQSSVCIFSPGVQVF
jgi:hypothetical protein